MAMHSLITPDGIEAGAPHPGNVFPRFTQAEPIPGLAGQPPKLGTAAEQVAALNAVQVALNAILAEGGAHVR